MLQQLERQQCAECAPARIAAAMLRAPARTLLCQALTARQQRRRADHHLFQLRPAFRVRLVLPALAAVLEVDE
eukprot:7070473-Prymnesium_polylepis.1